MEKTTSSFSTPYNVQEAFCIADEICDYIPFVSTISNIVDLIAKAIFDVIRCFSERTIEEMRENLYVKHLDDKSYFRSLVGLIPIFGNFALCWYECVRLKETVSSRDEGVPNIPDLSNIDNSIINEEVPKKIETPEIKVEKVETSDNTYEGYASVSDVEQELELLKELNNLRDKEGHSFRLYTCCEEFKKEVFTDKSSYFYYFDCTKNIITLQNVNDKKLKYNLEIKFFKEPLHYLEKISFIQDSFYNKEKYLLQQIKQEKYTLQNNIEYFKMLDIPTDQHWIELIR